MRTDAAAPTGADRSAIDSWEDEGGALQSASPAIPCGRIEPIIVIALVAVAGICLYQIARILVLDKEK